MKKTLHILFFALICAAAHAGNKAAKDTNITDNWSVIYNGKEVLAFKVKGINIYYIDSIADNSTIVIDYYTDHPCAKCLCRLELRDEDSKVLAPIEKQGFGDGAPFKLPGKQFRQLVHNHKVFLYFNTDAEGQWGTWLLLGIVQTK